MRRAPCDTHVCLVIRDDSRWQLDVYLMEEKNLQGKNAGKVNFKTDNRPSQRFFVMFGSLRV